MSSGVILLLFLKLLVLITVLYAFIFGPRTIESQVLGHLYHIRYGFHLAGAGLKLNQILVGDSHKLCATFVLAYLAGRTDYSSEVLWPAWRLHFSFDNVQSVFLYQEHRGNGSMFAPVQLLYVQNAVRFLQQWDLAVRLWRLRVLFSSWYQNEVFTGSSIVIGCQESGRSQLFLQHRQRIPSHFGWC